MPTKLADTSSVIGGHIDTARAANSNSGQNTNGFYIHYREATIGIAQTRQVNGCVCCQLIKTGLGIYGDVAGNIGQRHLYIIDINNRHPGAAGAKIRYGIVDIQRIGISQGQGNRVV